jgi:amino acid transporter
MNGGEVLIPVVLFISMAAMIVAVAYLKTRENMAMIEKGMNPKDKLNRPAPFRSLKWGLLILGAGVGLFLAFMIDIFALSHRGMHEDKAGALYFSLIGIGGGLGLVVSYLVEKKHWLDKEN